MSVGSKIPRDKIPKHALQVKLIRYKKDADRIAGLYIEQGNHAVIQMYYISDLRWYKIYYWPKKRGE